MQQETTPIQLRSYGRVPSMNIQGDLVFRQLKGQPKEAPANDEYHERVLTTAPAGSKRITSKTSFRQNHQINNLMKANDKKENQEEDRLYVTLKRMSDDLAA